MNVYPLGWVIDSNTVRSVTCVSLSFPEPVITGGTHGKEPPTGTGSCRWRGLDKDHRYRFYPLEWTTGTDRWSVWVDPTVDHYNDLILRGRTSTIWKWIRQISRELYFRSSGTIVSCVRSDDVTTQKGSRVRPALHFRRVCHRLCFGGYCCLLWIDEAKAKCVSEKCCLL
jgi:hypothetical protein